MAPQTRELIRLGAASVSFESPRTLRKKTPKIRNIGPVSQQWLEAIGIHTLQDVEKAGVENIVFALKAKEGCGIRLC